MNIGGKTILITGAKRIGKTVAKRLAEHGANLAIVYNSSKEDADEIMAEAHGLGVEAISIRADISNQTDVLRLIEEAVSKFGAIDGLVHMASPYPRTPFGEITSEVFDKIMRSIVFSSILLGQEVSRKMNEGKIIFFSDWSVLHAPYKNYLVYNAAKSAVDGVTKSLARELAPKIAVNAIAPGPILKPPDLTEEENQETLLRTPLNRWGGAEEIAKAVLYLFDSDFTTGVILPVDGGRSIA